MSAEVVVFPTHWRGGLPDTDSGVESVPARCMYSSPSAALVCRDKTVLDLGCGDMVYSRNVISRWDGYVGVDIKRRDCWSHFEKRGALFTVADITSGLRDSWPRPDIVLCRNLLEHLPNEMVLPILAYIQSVGAAALITTVPTAHNNDRLHYPSAVSTPFDVAEVLGLPRHLIPESTSDKFLGYWEFNN